MCVGVWTQAIVGLSHDEAKLCMHGALLLRYRVNYCGARAKCDHNNHKDKAVQSTIKNRVER